MIIKLRFTDRKQLYLFFGSRVLDGRHHFTHIFPMRSIFLEATKTFVGGDFLQKNLTVDPTETARCYQVVELATPLENDGVKVTWDDDIHNIWKNNPNVPNHQPDRGVKTIMRRLRMLRNFGSKRDIEHFCRSIW